MRAPRFRLLRFVAAIAAPSLLLSACGPSAPSASPGSRPVTFTAPGGVELEGRLFEAEGASAGVVLAHMQPADQSSWFEEAATLADDGYRTLTFNFRGYCPGGEAGCSSGETDVALLWRDVLSAVRFLRSTGVPRVAVIGASMGGTAALVAASRPGTRIGAVATLSAPIAIGALTASPETLAAAPSAKLFVAGNGDVSAADDAERMYDLSVPPKRVEIVPSDDHGTDILEGNQGPNVRRLLSVWLAQFVPVQAPAQEDA
ncbi:MAG: alpha/beta hydrolase [Actinomycetota bacterium]|nr:alpha/beta hydrolase [Actinomycetota bacterium]